MDEVFSYVPHFHWKTESTYYNDVVSLGSVFFRIFSDIIFGAPTVLINFATSIIYTYNHIFCGFLNYKNFAA